MVWIFGDSFSTSFENYSLQEWSSNYIVWKGYVPKTYGDIISDQLGVGVKHMAQGGLDNDTIYELVCENAPLINKDDIIIIGWSSIERFRLSSNFNWIRVIPNFQTNMKTLSNISEQTLEEILVNRTLYQYRDEYIKRKNFLNWVFRDNIIIHWTPFNNQFNLIHGYSDINTIQMETNGEVNDGHYSETGHQQLSNNFMRLIKNKEDIHIINNIEKKII
jgi:hypothetical protein